MSEDHNAHQALVRHSDVPEVRSHYVCRASEHPTHQRYGAHHLKTLARYTVLASCHCRALCGSLLGQDRRIGGASDQITQP